MNDGPKYSFSFDGSRYDGDFDTREEALEEAHSCDRDEPCYTGVSVACEIGEFAGGHADTIIENMKDAMYDTVGEVAEDWGPSDEHMKILDDRIAAVIEAWAVEFKQQPEFWKVAEIVAHPASGVTHT